ncbi:hypothetical protein QYG89_16265 [Bacillus sp. B190/17]|uniref:Uncharacterized protein n=1 Tax=Bacillus lumedeiriae TaxID=3058829 RepID=A0ABW8ICD8_9BACI
MSFLNWVSLLLYILIPSAVTFGIIFGLWRLIDFLVISFKRFTRKMDGMEELSDEHNRPRSNKINTQSRPFPKKRSVKREMYDEFDTYMEKVDEWEILADKMEKQEKQEIHQMFNKLGIKEFDKWYIPKANKSKKGEVLTIKGDKNIDDLLNENERSLTSQFISAEIKESLIDQRTSLLQMKKSDIKAVHRV